MADRADLLRRMGALLNTPRSRVSKDYALTLLAEARDALVNDAERTRTLESVEEAAYGMYSVVCAGGTLTLEDRAVEAYTKASEMLWADEIADSLRCL